MLIAKVQKWGNSQGLRLPKQVLEMSDISVGDDLEVVVGDGEITVKKPRKKYDLTQLVKRIPKNYKPKEIDLGPPVGKEEW